MCKLNCFVPAKSPAKGGKDSRQKLELDRQLAACSSPKRSSAGSVRSSPSSVRTSPVQQNVYLTQRSLLQHELETEVNLCSDADWDDNAQSSAQAERTALAQALLVPKAAAVARIAAASPPKEDCCCYRALAMAIANSNQENVRSI